MKKSLFIAVALIAGSTSFAQATPTVNAKYVAADDTTESMLCAVAGTNGYESAKAKAQALAYPMFSSLTCNGVKVKNSPKR